MWGVVGGGPERKQQSQIRRYRKCLPALLYRNNLSRPRGKVHFGSDAHKLVSKRKFITISSWKLLLV